MIIFPPEATHEFEGLVEATAGGLADADVVPGEASREVPLVEDGSLVASLEGEGHREGGGGESSDGEDGGEGTHCELRVVERRAGWSCCCLLSAVGGWEPDFLVPNAEPSYTAETGGPHENGSASQHTTLPPPALSCVPERERTSLDGMHAVQSIHFVCAEDARVSSLGACSSEHGLDARPFRQQAPGQRGPKLGSRRPEDDRLCVTDAASLLTELFRVKVSADTPRRWFRALKQWIQSYRSSFRPSPSPRFAPDPTFRMLDVPTSNWPVAPGLGVRCTVGRPRVGRYSHIVPTRIVESLIGDQQSDMLYHVARCGRLGRGRTQRYSSMSLLLQACCRTRSLVAARQSSNILDAYFESDLGAFCGIVLHRVLVLVHVATLHARTAAPSAQAATATSRQELHFRTALTEQHASISVHHNGAALKTKVRRALCSYSRVPPFIFSIRCVRALGVVALVVPCVLNIPNAVYVTRAAPVLSILHSRVRRAALAHRCAIRIRSRINSCMFAASALALTPVS